MPSDQDLNCLLFDSLAYFWSKCNQCRSKSIGTDVPADLDLHWSHTRKNAYISRKEITTTCPRDSNKDLSKTVFPWSEGYLWFFLMQLNIHLKHVSNSKFFLLFSIKKNGTLLIAICWIWSPLGITWYFISVIFLDDFKACNELYSHFKEVFFTQSLAENVSVTIFQIFFFLAAIVWDQNL
jgi:hypothetical protein